MVRVHVCNEGAVITATPALLLMGSEWERERWRHLETHQHLLALKPLKEKCAFPGPALPRPAAGRPHLACSMTWGANRFSLYCSLGVGCEGWDNKPSWGQDLRAEIWFLGHQGVQVCWMLQHLNNQDLDLNFFFFNKICQDLDFFFFQQDIKFS